MMDKLPDELHEFDDIIISGISSSPENSVFADIQAVVATINREGGFLKVWPVNDEANNGDKIWFDVKKITSLRIMEG